MAPREETEQQDPLPNGSLPKGDSELVPLALQSLSRRLVLLRVTADMPSTDGKFPYHRPWLSDLIPSVLSSLTSLRVCWPWVFLLRYTSGALLFPESTTFFPQVSTWLAPTPP